MSESTCDRCLLPVDPEELEVAQFTHLEQKWCGTCVDRMSLVAREVDVWLLGLDEPAA